MIHVVAFYLFATIVVCSGALTILWQEDGRIRMTGPATESYRGSFEWDDYA